MSARLPARCVALAAVAGMAAHLSMVADGAWMAVAAVVMIAACAPCAWGMWRRPTAHSARMLTVMSLVMALVHVGMALGPVTLMDHAHHATGPAITAASAGHSAMALGIAAADFAVAWLAALWLGRARRPRTAPAMA
ncbi:MULTISPECIES: hypothetical protein [Arthrobacter]|uniref:Uncharacterized protein n=2 Tax=Arthrobacter TaxID=1663 RepID=A0ABU9KFT3_9MICC|nr:hypothetical protein [Arthrobacter sp. YJM1]MDP5225746.1 hypothetical protein [Arthrobacter sp. YJM1]